MHSGITALTMTDSARYYIIARRLSRILAERICIQIISNISDSKYPIRPNSKIVGAGVTLPHVESPCPCPSFPHQPRRTLCYFFAVQYQLIITVAIYDTMRSSRDKKGSLKDVVMLTLCRHGETVANRLRITQGQMPGALTKLGALQAEALGRRLSTEAFDRIISSDLQRTIETTSLVLKHYPTRVPILLDPTLREKSAGVHEGMPYGSQQKFAKDNKCNKSISLLKS